MIYKSLLLGAICAIALASPASAHKLPSVVCVGPAGLQNPHCSAKHALTSIKPKPKLPAPTPAPVAETALIQKRPASVAHNVLKGANTGVFVCVGSVVAAAMHANVTQNRELNFTEAASCGTTYWTGGFRLNRLQAGSNIGEITTCHGAHYKQPGQRYCGA